MYKRIYVNQCGYLPEMVKKVTFQSAEPVSFSVCASDGSCVYTGVTEKEVTSEAATETDQIGDFSPVTKEGVYYIRANGLGESDAFPIGDGVYQELYQKAMEFYYLQRCGQELDQAHAGIYAHPACHTSEALVYGTDRKLDVTGGWHDAGDYGRYVGPGAMTVAQLLLGYEKNRMLAESYPGFLEELKVELDWMMKMQREDGALYHKVTCRSFCGFVMPQEETEELVISPVSVTATADFAAVAAMAVSFYKNTNPEYADRLKQASRRAYASLAQLDMPTGFHNPPEISTGEYDDAQDTDERYFAAAALYKAFGDTSYRDDFETMAKEKIYQGYGWADMGSYGNIAYLASGRDTDPLIADKIKNEMLSLADSLLQKSDRDGYGTALAKEEYIWGSNLSVANNGLHLMDAFYMTGDEKYRTAAREQLHYLLGRNPMGLCYLTGCGTDAVKRPHHRPSGYLGKAMPGMLSGGPCSWLADDVAKELLKDAPPAKCLADMTGSYSTNEVTIYWNSAFVQLLLEVI